LIATVNTSSFISSIHPIVAVPIPCDHLDFHPNLVTFLSFSTKKYTVNDPGLIRITNAINSFVEMYCSSFMLLTKTNLKACNMQLMTGDNPKSNVSIIPVETFHNADITGMPAEIQRILVKETQRNQRDFLER